MYQEYNRLDDRLGIGEKVMDQKTHGVLALLAGLLLPVMLLVGGGFVTATHASYWCGVFGFAYAIGLVFPGIFVFLSARTQTNIQTRQETMNIQYPWIGSFIAIAAFLGSSVFFKSDFFASSAGKHTFTIIEAVFMAQLIPLGLGWYFANANETEPPVS